MGSLRQVYYGNPIIRLKLTVWQRFQSLKENLDTELRGILAAYPEETEQVATEINSLASYIKDSSAATRSALIARTAKNSKNESNKNANAEPAAFIADSFSSSGQANGKGVTQDKSVNHHHSLFIKWSW